MLQALPDDILFGILQHVSSWEIHDGEDFKQQLYLLGIFQRLRAIVLPKIYNVMYINSSADNNPKTQSYANEYSNAFAEYIDSNAAIIALTNCTHMVRSAIILVDELSITYAELYNTIDALQSCAAIWPNITTLEITMEHNIDYNSLSESQWMRRCCMSKEISQELAYNMPGVTDLTLLNQFISPDISEFYNQVSDTYADQLVNLYTEYNINYVGRSKLEVLQYLHISMCRTVNVLPCVNSRTLVNLQIGNITDNILWSSFMDSKDDPVIEFPCLKILRLHFFDDEDTEQTDINMPELLLKFPVLSSLIIQCNAKVCPFFKMAEFPDKVDSIYIRALPELLTQFKDEGMPTAKKVIIHNLYGAARGSIG